MKLSALEIIVTSPPAPGWGGQYWILVKLQTACGIIGWGEVYASSIGPEAMKAVIQDVFERHMLDEDPANIELMFRRAYSSGFTGRPDLTVMGAFSGLEIACWDILGKSRGEPVWRLLGGKLRDRVRAYSYLYPLGHHDPSSFWHSPEMAAESALAYVGQGYTAVKFDPAGPYTILGGHHPSVHDISLSVAFCDEIHKALGQRADLLFGTHGQLSFAGALRLGAAIEPFSPLWFEEPIPPDLPHELAKLSARLKTPIAVGERLCTKTEFLSVLREGGAQIVQPALGRCGGLWEARKIAALAESFGAEMAPHLYAGPIEWAANIHLGLSSPNLLMVETIETDFHKRLISGCIKVENGYVEAPQTPGLGIEVNEELARSYPYRGEKLHLEMQENPPEYHTPNHFSGGAVRT